MFVFTLTEYLVTLKVFVFTLMECFVTLKVLVFALKVLVFTLKVLLFTLKATHFELSYLPRHSMKSPQRAGQPKLRNASTLTENDNRASADNSETDESESMKVMPLTLGQKTQVISWIHQFNSMRKMPVIRQDKITLFIRGISIS